MKPAYRNFQETYNMMTGFEQNMFIGGEIQMPATVKLNEVFTSSKSQEKAQSKKESSCNSSRSVFDFVSPPGSQNNDNTTIAKTPKLSSSSSTNVMNISPTTKAATVSDAVVKSKISWSPSVQSTISQGLTRNALFHFVLPDACSLPLM